MKRQILFIFTVVVLASCASLQTKVSKKDKFSEFQGMFGEVTLPFEVNGSENPKPVSGRYLQEIIGNKEFVPELKQSSFGRGVTSNCSYVAALYQNSEFCTLCYLVANSFYDTLGERKYVVATYKKSNGQTIDKIEFAGQVSPMNYTSGVFSALNEISISTYKNTWKEDPGTKGYAGNTIVKTELVKTISYALNEKGHFKKISIRQKDPRQVTVNR